MRFPKTTPWSQPQPAKPWAKAPQPITTSSAPARPRSTISDVLVPILQAAVTGALPAALVTYIVSRIVPNWCGLLDLFIILALIISGVTWCLLLLDTRRLLWAIESMFNVDLDRDNRVADRERIIKMNPGQAKREVEQQQAKTDASRFRQFIEDLRIHPTDSRFWEPRIGRDNYNYYRDALIEFGWADWNSYGRNDKPNKRKGWELTIPVDDILARIQD